MYPSRRAIFLEKKRYPPKNKSLLISIRSLYYIKNRNKVISEEEYEKSCEVYKQLEKFHMREYQNGLSRFHCSNEDVMKMVIRYIYYHNTRSLVLPKMDKRVHSALENYE